MRLSIDLMNAYRYTYPIVWINSERKIATRKNRKSTREGDNLKGDYANDTRAQ